MGELDFFNKKVVDIMENKKGKTLKLISYISLCAFSLVSLFSGVLAWFTARRVQDPDSDSMRVVNPTGVFDYMSVHEMFYFDEGHDKYYFKKEEAGRVYNDGTNRVATSGDTSLMLGHYNLLEQRHPVLLLFHFNQLAESGVTVTAKTTVPFLGDVERNNQILLPLDQGQTERELNGDYETVDGVKVYTSLYENGNFPLSSIIRYSSHEIGSQTNLDAIVEEDKIVMLTNDDVSQESDPTDCYFFEHISTFTYDSMVSFTTVDNQIKGTTATEKKWFEKNTIPEYMAVIVDYYDMAIEAIYNAYLGYDIVSDPSNYLRYCCDFTLTI